MPRNDDRRFFAFVSIRMHVCNKLRKKPATPTVHRHLFFYACFVFAIRYSRFILHLICCCCWLFLDELTIELYCIWMCMPILYAHIHKHIYSNLRMMKNNQATTFLCDDHHLSETFCALLLRSFITYARIFRLYLNKMFYLL